MMMPAHALEIGELVRLPAQDPRVALWRIRSLRQSAGEWVYHQVSGSTISSIQPMSGARMNGSSRTRTSSREWRLRARRQSQGRTEAPRALAEREPILGAPPLPLACNATTARREHRGRRLVARGSGPLLLAVDSGSAPSLPGAQRHSYETSAAVCAREGSVGGGAGSLPRRVERVGGPHGAEDDIEEHHEVLRGVVAEVTVACNSRPSPPRFT